ncbi:MAG: nicotinate (nicotinamide) nucleotide adenylyltransferase [Candidatus Delongbacteria bacterium]|nr:nicotinate (nicotinamide) nucleotide adenylyltransferase [Candidatus Delongbacteria bacterium]
MINVLFMGGTFDPVHRGHLAMAHQAYQTLRPDLLLFVPAARNPLKEQQPLATTMQRLEMLQIALQQTGFEIDDWEMHQEGVSYTWQTVNHLRERFGERARLGMLIGEELLEQLPDWSHWPELERELEFVILPRKSAGRPSNYPRCWRQLDAPQVDISATQIRDTIAAGASAAGLLPPAVWDYIQQQLLYRRVD